MSDLPLFDNLCRTGNRGIGVRPAICDSQSFAVQVMPNDLRRQFPERPMRAQSLVKLPSNAKALTQNKPLKTRDLLLVVMAVARGNPENAWENRKDRKPDPGLVFPWTPPHT